MKSQVGIYGHIKVYITRENGIKELVFEDKNAIQSGYADIIVDALDTGYVYAIITRFNGNANPPPNGQDGIAIKDSGGLWYEMDTDAGIQSGTNVLFVATFTGVGITVADANSVLFGHNWVNAGSSFGIAGVSVYAKPSSWSSQAVLDTETLTIEWTIKHEVS